MTKIEVSRLNARIAAGATLAFLLLLIWAILTVDWWRVCIAAIFTLYMGQLAIRQYLALSQMKAKRINGKRIPE